MKKEQSKKELGRMVKGFGYFQWVEQYLKRQYGASVRDEEKELGDMDGRMTTEMSVRALILIVGEWMFMVRLILFLNTRVLAHSVR